MKIILEIPKEFEPDFKIDRFGDSLERLMIDAHSLAGNYEKEVANMLINAFSISGILPKGHGRLIDADELLHKVQDYGEGQRRMYLIDPNYVKKAPTIIEADTGEEE